MAAYVKFYNKVSGEKADWYALDKEIYELLGHEYDDKKWCGLTKERIEGIDWYNIIGFCLACGQSYKELRSHISDDYTEDGKELHDNMLKVIDYLEQNYTVDCGRCW